MDSLNIEGQGDEVGPRGAAIGGIFERSMSPLTTHTLE